MKKSKVFSVFLAAISITTSFMISTPNAATNNSSTESRFNLEDSKLKEYSSYPEVQNLIENLSENALEGNVVETYLKVGEDSNGNSFEKAYTESEYLEQSLITPMDLPIEQNFGWIKLRLESYQKAGTNDITVAGFYEWLSRPFFSGHDTLAIGHDASITFNNQSCFGAFISPDYDSVTESNIQKVQRVNRADGNSFKTDASGVAYKFKLGDSQGINDPVYPSILFDNGMMYVEGTVLNGSGNLQLSYGHAQLSLNYNVNDVVSFLTTGAITFNVAGTQELKTIGDRVVLK